MAVFVYDKAVAEVEKIIAELENPLGGVSGMDMKKADKLSARAREILDKCYAWLHGEREKFEEEGK